MQRNEFGVSVVSRQIICGCQERQVMVTGQFPNIFYVADLVFIPAVDVERVAVMRSMAAGPRVQKPIWHGEHVFPHSIKDLPMTSKKSVGGLYDAVSRPSGNVFNIQRWQSGGEGRHPRWRNQTVGCCAAHLPPPQSPFNSLVSNPPDDLDRRHARKAPGIPNKSHNHPLYFEMASPAPYILDCAQGLTSMTAPTPHDAIFESVGI